MTTMSDKKANRNRIETSSPSRRARELALFRRQLILNILVSADPDVIDLSDIRQRVRDELIDVYGPSVDYNADALDLDLGFLDRRLGLQGIAWFGRSIGLMDVTHARMFRSRLTKL